MTEPRGKLLIVDDEPIMLNALSKTLADRGFDIKKANRGDLAWEIFEKGNVDLVITDLKMPQFDGFWLLKKVKEQDPQAVIIVMTAHGSIDIAVEAMKNGAYDFITKPFSFDQIEFAVSRGLEKAGLLKENRNLKKAKEETGFYGMLGNNHQMGKIFELIEKAAPSDASILIMGESGTGKELVARALHDLSRKKDGPFMAVNCSAIPETLIESELFGYVKGAFTGADFDRKGRFEMAQDGTIFLDEIGELPLLIQVKLLRVLQEKVIERVGSGVPVPINCRILSATNRNLEEEIKEGNFREDLYWRLNVISVNIPPLRERKDDIVGLLSHFIKKLALENHQEIPTLSNQALEILENYSWPGNIRELQNAMQRALVLCGDGIILPEHLPPAILGAGGLKADEESLDFVERAHIIDVLNRYSWNLSESARKLKIDRKTLYNKMKRYGIGEI